MVPSEKVLQGALYEWESHMQKPLVIRGRTVFDNPRTGTVRGNWIVTSTVQRFFRSEGILYVETANSLYMLFDEDPLTKKG